MKKVMPFLLCLVFVAGLPGKERHTRAYTYRFSADNDEKVKIECKVEDGSCRVSIARDGEVEEYSFPLDSMEAIPELEGLEDSGLKRFLFSLKDFESEDDEDERDRDFDIDVYAGMPFPGYEGTWLGVQIQPLTDQLRDYFKVKGSGGVLVTEVVEDSPADKAGLEAGDVIVSVDRKRIKDSGDLVGFIRKMDPEDEVKIRIVRDGRKETVTAVLDSRVPRITKRMLHVRPDMRVLPDLPFVQERFAPEMKNELKSLKKELKELKKELEELKKEMQETKGL